MSDSLHLLNASKENDWRKMMDGLRRTHRWSEEEVESFACDPSHIQDEQIYSYLDRTLDKAARSAVEYHAVGCAFCLSQLAEVGTLLHQTRQSQTFPLRDLQSKAQPKPTTDAPEPIDREGESADGIEWRFCEDGSAYTLFLRVPSAATVRVVRYRLRGKDDCDRSGLLAMQSEDDWLIAQTRFTENNLFAVLGGECRVEVALVGPSDLTAEDRVLLEEALRSIGSDTEKRIFQQLLDRCSP